MKKAFITGITGQDGSYLAESLLEKGYQVFGLTRRTSTQNFARIKRVVHNPNLKLISGDLIDQHSLTFALKDIQPDEIYNLAAQSFVQASWEQPVLTGEFTGIGVTRVLEAMRLASPNAKFYQASSSEMFGKVRETPQTELTPFYPRSPYGVAKVYGHWITVNYRESYDMFAVSGILFNHESPRRGLEFVTRKIANGIARVKLGKQPYIELGNLDAKRDWGYAKDYVEAMWLMLQQNEPDDYVVATGETHSVREFLELSCKSAGITDWQSVYKHNPVYDRPAEVDLLIGDPSKAKEKLGWQPTIDFEQLVDLMVQSELEEESKLKD
ncbi:MAG: GDP-mannose 4,6-dehydratase [Candidatus Pacebacteria bacterium CG10_big_fil_rev_8_21_14_0_10_36_11]|nr:GDP-mannose 4,6-dehydratase [Candidatus Pacearchaeota archaeon]OIP74434.1 MAG: GDP-mannose 4,6-dehydratase [Candidatus Pacebacteria bacterium CG2_30_36_39]PIR64998.1 MAG: GDP-mannose 4,6-dehydratase [Candidatus Pacebacteria bacterium CG10_big_fil_rev_8_21_14_0_10_36_11]PJC42478.1 MAG: GDP-mannose 4,6-dehydratase [Candidatus Pacebacteria bacterium CG_4_9_14_0_2_um_filter_36_8]